MKLLKIKKGKSLTKEELKNLNVKVSKLGQGISIGSSVEDLEDGTLLSAFKNRTEIKNNSD